MQQNPVIHFNYSAMHILIRLISNFVLTPNFAIGTKCILFYLLSNSILNKKPFENSAILKKKFKKTYKIPHSLYKNCIRRNHRTF